MFPTASTLPAEITALVTLGKAKVDAPTTHDPVTDAETDIAPEAVAAWATGTRPTKAAQIATIRREYVRLELNVFIRTPKRCGNAPKGE
jgi:hypothetical protein